MTRRRTPLLRRRLLAAYTAVEVMVAMSLLGLGAAGVMSIQRTAVSANFLARRLDMANSLARLWIERLHADAALWTEPNSTNPNVTNVTNTKFIYDPSAGVLIDKGRSATDQGWFLPDQAVTPSGTSATMVSPAFDMLGNDVDPASANVMYCTHVKLDCLTQTVLPTGVTPASCSLIRANVRVFFVSNQAAAPANWCSETVIQGVQNAANSPFHFVYAVSALRQNTN